MLKHSLISVLTAALLALSPATASAQRLLSLDDIAKVDLLSGWRTPQGTHMAAIRIQLADGWKTYWRFAGESGIAPQFDWTGSQNLSQVDIHWPIPTVFDPDASRSYGYKGTVILPIELTPAHSANGTISLHGQINIGVCEEVCVPLSVQLDGVLQNSGSKDPAIVASLGQQPTPANLANLRSAECAIAPISDGLQVTAKLNLPSQGGHETVVFELPDRAVWVDEARSTRKGGLLTAVTDFVPPAGAPFLLNRSDIRITVFGSGGVVDIQGCTAG